MAKLFSGLKMRFQKITSLAKINLTIVSLTALSLILVTILLIRFTVEPSLEKDRLLHAESCQAMTETVSSKYNLVYNQSQLMLSNDHVAGRIASAQWKVADILDFEDEAFIRDYTDALFYSDEDILDIIIVSADSKYTFARSSDVGRSLSVSANYTELSAISQLANTDSSFGAYLDAEQAYVRTPKEPVISFVAKIYNPFSLSNRNVCCYLLLNYPLHTFANAYQQFGSLSGSRLYIVNNRQQILYSNIETALGQSFEDVSLENCEVRSSAVGLSGIRVVGVIPNDLIQTESWRLILTMLSVLVPCMAFILICSLLLNRRYQQRVRHLSDAMDAASRTHLKNRIELDHTDELDRLAQQFNQMCDDLDTYIDMHYRAELGRQTAELNALQAQINPHFLFNTIEGIRMHAVEEGALDISDMLAQLGNLFHWMVMMDKQIVYLEDEVDYVDSYLNLQRLRYDDSFDTELDIDADTLYLGVPKFTLQPIVENALLHGLKENKLSGIIAIRAHCEGQTLVLTISDNGSGMSAKTLEKLVQHMRKENASCNDFGIGMQNIQARINLLFGRDYGITVESAPNCGTTVTVRIPAIAKKEMETYVSNHSCG